MTLKEAEKRHLDKLFESARMGDGWPCEADEALNNSCRGVVDAMAEEHGSCWLGKINLYREDRGRPCLWKWNGELVLNFSCAFVLPDYDAELEQLILTRSDAPYTTSADDLERINLITERIRAVGGMMLFWT